MRFQHLRFAELPTEVLLDGRWRRTAFRGDDSLVTVNWLDPGIPPPPPHHHPFDQVSMVLEGAMRFEVDGEERTVAAGEVLVIGADVPHTAVAVGEGTALNIDVYAPPRPDYLYLTEYQGRTDDPPDQVTPRDRAGIADLLADWAHALDLGDPRTITTLLTPDAVVTGLGEPLDLAGMTRWSQRRAADPTRRTRHHLTNTRSRTLPTGVLASTTYLLLYTLDPASHAPVLEFQGHYHDEIVRTDQGLRFQRRDIVRFPSA